MDEAKRGHSTQTVVLALIIWSAVHGGLSARQSSADPATRAGTSQTLPGGASQLQETHGDWRVVCASQNNQILCTLTQQQADKDSRQLILGIELKPVAAGKAEGTLILPFGLSVAQPIRMQIDDGTPHTAQIRTCLPVGCLVSLSFDSPAVATLKQGVVLNVRATADGGQDTTFKISLNGFASALDRTTGLSK